MPRLGTQTTEFQPVAASAPGQIAGSVICITRLDFHLHLYFTQMHQSIIQAKKGSRKYI